MMKKITTLLMCLVMMPIMFTGCSTKNSGNNNNNSQNGAAQNQETAPEESKTEQEASTDQEPIQVGALRGPTAMGMVQLMNEDASGDNNRYEFTIAGAPDEITTLLAKGDLDLAAIPANLASALYNKTDGAIEVVAINTLGVIYIVENGESIKSIEDLRGKTIYASGKGATPEYVLNYILSMNGIDPEKDVTIEWKSEHAECAAALANSEHAIAMLPQPFVTIAQKNNEAIRIALDLTEEWNALQRNEDTASTLVTGVIAGRKEFLEANPDRVSEFMDAYGTSVNYVNENPEEAAALIGEYEIVPAEVAVKAIPYCNITFIEGTDMQEKLSGYLSVLYDQNPQAVGGALPDDDFYYVR